MKPTALAASLALTGLFVIPRLPPSADMILPRRAGFALFEAAMARRGGLGTLCLVLLGLCAVMIAAVLWRERRKLRWSWKLIGIVPLVLIARFDVRCILDLIQNAWFMPESMDLREPLTTWAFLLITALLLLRSVESLFEWAAAKPSKAARRRAAAWGAALLGAGLWAKAWGNRWYDAGKPSLSEAAGITAGPRLTRAFIVLTEKEGVPDYEVHQLEVGVPGQSEYSPENLGRAAAYVLTRPSVFRLAGLRYLYGGCTLAMDATGLRGALVAGHHLGDPAAGVLLLENLAWARPGEAAEQDLALLSDERTYRVGPLAAAQLAVAYEHIGLADKADYWRQRSGIPDGLLARREPGGTLKPGRIRGQLQGARGNPRVGLYIHRDALAPYALGPTQLVDAVTADRAGRFEFKGLAAGNYFLAFYLDFDRGRAPDKIRLRGHRGDIHLSKAHPESSLPSIVLQY